MRRSKVPKSLGVGYWKYLMAEALTTLRRERRLSSSTMTMENPLQVLNLKYRHISSLKIQKSMWR